MFIKHKKKIVSISAVLVFVFGVIGFYISTETNGCLDVINNTIALFAFSYPSDDNLYLDIAKSLAIFTVFYGVISFFFINIINKLVVKNVQKKPFDLVIGLNSQTLTLLNAYNSDSVLIVEEDKNNQDLDNFREQGFGILSSSFKDSVNDIDFTHLNNCVISTDDDMQNITLAMMIVKKIEKVKKQKLFVHVENRELNTLFKQNIIIDSREKHVDIVPFSMYENMTKELFSKHFILGDKTSIITTDQPYSIILIGNSSLALQIIYHIAILAHLPNENHLTIYCVDREADKFYEKIKKYFAGIENIPTLTIEPIKQNFETLSFYTQELWHTKNLTNIMIANENEENNLTIATSLQDITFVKQIAQDEFHTKVLFAMYENRELGNKINNDKNVFKNFFSFGNIAEISTKGNIIDENLDNIAKLINYGYEKRDLETGNLDREAIQKKWFELSSFHKKESNKAQALHIDIKLLALGLKKEKSNKSLEKLLKYNKQKLDTKLTDRNITDEKLRKYKSKYFPKEFTTLFDKIVRAEHNRWNAYHHLNGWSYSGKRNDEAKEHDCLLPIAAFDTDAKKETYQYDIQALLFIPYYLAYSGYEIV